MAEPVGVWPLLLINGIFAAFAIYVIWTEKVVPFLEEVDDDLF
jgi:hypothetical protein